VDTTCESKTSTTTCLQIESQPILRRGATNPVFFCSIEGVASPSMPLFPICREFYDQIPCWF